MVRSEIEVVLRCENYFQVDALTSSQCFIWFCSHFTVGVTRRLLLSSRVSLLVFNLLTIRERESKSHYLLPFIQIVNDLITTMKRETIITILSQGVDDRHSHLI